MQKEIQQSAYQYQQDIESSRKTVIGVNKFLIAEELPQDLLKVDPAVGEKQIARLKKLKAERDNAIVEVALKEIRQAAQTKENLVPLFVEAVKNYATLGEICGVLREVFGEHQQQPIF
jgi:methylmalonyl-CoA mutase N-terminal domain/subunit